MLSLEMAKKLKAVGIGMVNNNIKMYWISEVEELMYVGGGYEPDPEDVWLPNLSELLVLLENRCDKWECGYDSKHVQKYYAGIHLLKPGHGKYLYFADTIEDAVAKALLPLLEQEFKNNEIIKKKRIPKPPEMPYTMDYSLNRSYFEDWNPR